MNPSPALPSATVSLWRGAFDAILFDLDGVLTRTATLHAVAWKETFDEFLACHLEPGDGRLVPFEVDADYRRFVDGRPRADGARVFLDSRGIRLPLGTDRDPPEAETVWGLANRKRDCFIRLLRERGVEVDGGAVELIRAARGAGMKTAVVSSSRNCRLVLDAAGLTDLFDLVFDGNDAVREQLSGKPAPDAFLASARHLEVDPVRAVVLEDADAGVEAGRRGGFGCVIGVDRGGRGASLRMAGAHMTVTSLAEVTVTTSGSLAWRQTSALPSAVQEFARLAARLTGRPLAVFLDYDGTLTSIVARPQDARLSERTRAVLRELVALVPVTIVSGRDRTDVQSLIGVDALVYAGSHGFDIVGPGGTRLDDGPGDRFIQALDFAEDALRRRLAPVHGAVVERKRFTVAVHYRHVDPADATRLATIVDDIVDRHPALDRTDGKRVFELRPRIDWNKGTAVRHVLDLLTPAHGPRAPIYVGDDVTDEDAFRAVAVNGVPIVVRDDPRPTLAHYALENPTEVEVFLRRLVTALGAEVRA